MMRGGFGCLARFYFWMEYFSFGPYLQRCRCVRLSEGLCRKRALVYGDGDGRFLAKLLETEAYLAVTAVDASGRMLGRARRRVGSGAAVQWVQADARTWDPPREAYDLVVSHFFLDCFDEEELAGIVARVNAAAARDAVWIVSEFAIPRGRVAAHVGRGIVRALYLAFGLMTGLSVRRLPDYGRVLRDAGWRLEDRRELLSGLLVSDRWRRAAHSDN